MALYLKDCKVSCKYSWDELQALCRRHKLVCKQLAVTEDDFNDYVVDYLCNYRKIKGQEFFLVKWKGYSESGNTWEPFENLKCPKLLQQFRHDMRLALLRSNRPLDSSLLNASAVSFILQRAKQHVKLRRWEEKLNRACRHRGRIFVRNDVDLDGPPTNFTYINSNKIGEGVESSKSAIGCKCTDCIKDPLNGCCAGASDNCTAYNDKMQVKIRPGMPIYECNSRCQCGIDCRNRVVQRGIQYDLCIFKTANGRGWGVRTLERIPKNSFVMEYLGEIITSEEAERRGQIYDQQGVTYLFDLDYVVDVFTVDAAHYGNISHFVNHSVSVTKFVVADCDNAIYKLFNEDPELPLSYHRCDPNLQVYNVFIDVLDERLPRIAFFAKRAILEGEELNFDYKMTIDELDAESTKMDANFSMAGLADTPINPIHMECKCGAKSCRKYLF